MRDGKENAVQWCDDPGSLRVSVSFGLTVEGEPANVHFYSMSCEYELLPGTSALKPLRQCILSVVKSKISLFSSEIHPWNSVISLYCGFEMYFIYWFHTDILLFSLSPAQNTDRLSRTVVIETAAPQWKPGAIRTGFTLAFIIHLSITPIPCC